MSGEKLILNSDLYCKWNVDEIARKQENVYLILCQRFMLLNDVVHAIVTNESKDVRLGDVYYTTSVIKS